MIPPERGARVVKAECQNGGSNQPAETEIVRPLVTRATPRLPPLTLMVATASDFNIARPVVNASNPNEQRIYNSRLLWDGSNQSSEGAPEWAIAGPLLGAPQAAMMLETLVAWGAKRVLFWGWCGAVAETVRIGDFILATGAFIDEGTSLHYGGKHNQWVAAAGSLNDVIRIELQAQNVSFHEGPVWTTDGVFRETPAKVSRFQQQGALAVEMELAALFSVGRFRGVEVAGLLVVSDELSQLVWRPGFKTQRFKNGRRKLGEVIQTICRELKSS